MRHPDRSRPFRPYPRSSLPNNPAPGRPAGVFWRQRRGLRWVDPSGALRPLDCTGADPAAGLVESDGSLYWADGTARALLVVRLGE